MKNQSEIQVSGEQRFAANMRQIFDMILLKMTSGPKHARKRFGGVGLCPKGLISTKIFALALTVLEIFAKNHFPKN